MESVDYVVIGGGVVGLATAHQLLIQHPSAKVTVLEKEPEVALHQSGRNSGVIHSGIYYKPGSLKAENCRRGKMLLEAFCKEHDIAYRICGKVIVATNESEEIRLNGLLERGKQNGVLCDLISRERLKELEPAVQGRRALYVPEAGVIEFKDVAAKLSSLIAIKGGQVRCNTQVIAVVSDNNQLVIQTPKNEFRTKKLINCAGLYSDKILSLCGGVPEAKIIPFRGEYYFLKQSAAHLCQNLVYPVPDPKFPFLGVHVTRSIHDEVDCGPNAVLALAREGYNRTDFNLKEFLETVSFPGFYRMLFNNLPYAFNELSQSLFKTAFVRAVNRLIPDIKESDLNPAPAGVRAQAITINGKPVDDFVIQKTANAIHVLNAPSPAATSCLSIAESIVKMI